MADRRDSIHLCCKKLMIDSILIKNIMKFLHLMPLDSLQEVQVNCIWQLSALSLFAPLLGLNFSCLDDIGHGIKVERGALLFLHSTSYYLKYHVIYLFPFCPH